MLTLKNNEDIGLISFFYDFPYIANYVVVLNNVRINKIDFKYLNQILGNKQNCIYDLIKGINYKLKLYQERIFNINNIKLSISDKEKTDKNNKKMELTYLKLSYRYFQNMIILNFILFIVIIYNKYNNER